MHTKETLRKDLMSELLQISVRQIYRTLERCPIRGSIYFKVPEEVRRMKPGDKLLKVKEAAEILNCSVSTINRFFWEGKLSGAKLGTGKSSIRIFKSSVYALIEDEPPGRPAYPAGFGGAE